MVDESVRGLDRLAKREFLSNGDQLPTAMLVRKADSQSPKEAMLPVIGREELLVAALQPDTGHVISSFK